MKKLDIEIKLTDKYLEERRAIAEEKKSHTLKVTSLEKLEKEDLNLQTQIVKQKRD